MINENYPICEECGSAILSDSDYCGCCGTEVYKPPRKTTEELMEEAFGEYERQDTYVPVPTTQWSFVDLDIQDTSKWSGSAGTITRIEHYPSVAVGNPSGSAAWSKDITYQYSDGNDNSKN
jgi:hypothetical protein